MKKIILFSFLLMTVAACEQKKPSIKVPPVQTEKTVALTTDELQQVEMTIEGMMCAIGCAATIEKKLNATEGVATAKVDFDSKKAQIAFDAQQLNTLQLKEIIMGVGDAYSISDIVPLD